VTALARRYESGSGGAAWRETEEQLEALVKAHGIIAVDRIVYAWVKEDKSMIRYPA
jgi:hypothetical protein